MTTNEARPWTWTPPPFMNRVMTGILKTPLLHRAISHSILLLTYTGRRSGQQYTLPIGYWREGNRVTLLTKRFRTWWRNFEQPAPIKLRIEGKQFNGEAQAITDEATITQVLMDIIPRQPRQAEIWQIRLQDGNQPNADDVSAIAPKVVVIQIALAPST